MIREEWTPGLRTYVFTHPKLDGELITDSAWSERVTIMFMIKHLMAEYPGHFDLMDREDIETVSISEPRAFEREEV